MKYTYYIETYAYDRWYKTTEGGLFYLQGYMDAKKHYAPRLHHRLVRSDGKIIEELPAREDVFIGMIAGWPTAEQYERAGNEALERAKAIRIRQQEQTEPSREPCRLA